MREHFEHETELTTERRKYASLIEKERVNRWGRKKMKEKIIGRGREREIIKGKVLLDYCIELYEEEI